MDIFADLVLNTLSLILADLLLGVYKAWTRKNRAKGGPCDETMREVPNIEDFGWTENSGRTLKPRQYGSSDCAHESPDADLLASAGWEQRYREYFFG